MTPQRLKEYEQLLRRLRQMDSEMAGDLIEKVKSHIMPQWQKRVADRTAEYVPLNYRCE